MYAVNYVWVMRSIKSMSSRKSMSSIEGTRSIWTIVDDETMTILMEKDYESDEKNGIDDRWLTRPFASESR